MAVGVEYNCHSSMSDSSSEAEDFRTELVTTMVLQGLRLLTSVFVIQVFGIELPAVLLTLMLLWSAVYRSAH